MSERARRGLRGSVTFAIAAALLVVPARASAEGPGYVTIAFGRTQWVTTESCVRLPNTVDLGQVADALQARGLTATGNVVLDRIAESSRSCFRGYTLHPSWADIAALRDGHGWTFVSASRTYRYLTDLTHEQQWAESCGTLAELERRGHGRAWGLFAYPNNRFDQTVQSQIVSTCFAYGRTYRRASPNLRSEMTAPWFQKTWSVNGGRCHNTALACSQLSSTKTYYNSPDQLVKVLDVASDRWLVAQFYRFVTGRHVGLRFSWDCTSADWRNHWTSNVEMYCWGDFLRAIDRIPSTVVVTDPATVATAWGRVPG